MHISRLIYLLWDSIPMMDINKLLEWSQFTQVRLPVCPHDWSWAVVISQSETTEKVRIVDRASHWSARLLSPGGSSDDFRWVWPRTVSAYITGIPAGLQVSHALRAQPSALIPPKAGLPGMIGSKDELAGSQSSCLATWGAIVFWLRAAVRGKRCGDPAGPISSQLKSW